MEDFQRSTQSAAPRRSSRRPSAERGGMNVLLRIGVPLLLFIAGAAVVILVLKARRDRQWAALTLPSLETSETPPANFPGEGARPDPNALSPASAGTPAPAASAGPPRPEPPTLNEMQAAKRQATSFLKATSLGQRLEMIEPALPAQELESTVAAGPFPEIVTLRELPPNRNEVEGFIDFPFLVTFQGDAPLRQMLLMVRTRGQQEPKVLIQPVLDLLGERLAAFAAEPQETPMPQAFRAVIEPMPRVFEKGVPNSDDKFTFKLLTADGGAEIARAYCSVHSKLSEELSDEELRARDAVPSRFRWGRRIPATILLQWNNTDDPEHPYLWVPDLKSLDWSP